MKADQTADFSKPGRTTWLVLLVVLFLIVSFFGWMRTYETLRLWNLLNSLSLTVSPFYLAIGGVIWGISSLICAVLLWFRKRNAPKVSFICGVVLTLWYWVDQFFFSAGESIRTNWPFAAVFNLALLVYLFLVLREESGRDFFES